MILVDSASIKLSLNLQLVVQVVKSKMELEIVFLAVYNERNKLKIKSNEL